MQKPSALFRPCALFGLMLATFATCATAGDVQVQLPSGKQYTIKVIGTLPGGLPSYGSYGLAISPDGKITGKAYVGIGVNMSTHTFVYENGRMTDLGKIFTYSPEGSAGYGINNKGQVAGTSWVNIAGPYPARHAFLYENGYMRDLGALDTTGSSYAYGVNANGHVVGKTSVKVPGGIGIHAFLYRDGLMKDIGNLVSGSTNALTSANAINDSGQITGEAQPQFQKMHAFLYSDGQTTDLGTLGGSRSIGYAISSNGQVAGASYIAGDGAEHAFLYTGGTMTDLGALDAVNSEGRGVNASGEVVGFIQYAAGEHRAFLFSGGSMINLNDLLPAGSGLGSGWILTEANGINDVGQIVGTGYYYGPEYNGRTAFLMSPVVAPSLGSIALSATSLSLTEGGVAGSYTMVLSKAPTADVTVTVAPGTQLTASPTQVTFTTANWNVPQTVSVRAIQDNITEGPHTGVLTHSVASADAQYSGIAMGSVSVTISEAVIPVIQIGIPNGTIWTQPDLPVQGTAAPGTTVTLYVLNTTTGVASAVSAVVGADGKWNLVLTGLTDGTYELQAEADGIQGGKVTLVVDSHAPTSTVSVTSSNGPGASGWYAGTVNVTITAVDATNGQGVARSEYTLDGGVWTTFPGAGLSLTQDGNHSVCYRSVDKANNTEATRCVQIPIDTTAPQVSPVFNAVNNTLNLNAQDPASGVASIEVSMDGGQSWVTQTGPLSFGKDGSYTVHYRVRDNAGNLASGQTTVNIVTKPSITPAADQVAIEGTLQSINLGSFTDLAGDGPWSVDIDWGDGTVHGTGMLTMVGPLGTQSHRYVDSGMYTVTVKVTDQANNSDSKMFRVAVNNVAPSAGGITVTTTPVNINTALSVSTSFSDPGVVDTHTAIISWGDGTSSVGSVTEANGAGTVTGSHSYAVTGSYTVTVTVTDKDDGAASVTYQSIVVVDLAGARINGNGRIDSPAGALPANPGAAGNVNLQVRANYNGGSAVPTGSTSFDFNGGNLDFQSSAYEWLIVSGDKALLKGMGTINGAGNYGFLVSVIDNGKGKGSPDAFRIKIWDAASGVVVYDSQLGMADDADPTTLLSGGKITIK